MESPEFINKYNMTHWGKVLPKVSCTCITYGRPHLIGEAIASYLDQDYEGESELIILNDQPYTELVLDDSVVCKSNQSVKIWNDPIRYDTIGEKRNQSVKLATGQIMLPWDDDDIHLPWRISLTLERMKNKHHWKADSLWFWNHGEIKKKMPTKTMAPSMGGYSMEIFNKVGGYDPIQSGQDQTLDKKILNEGVRVVESLRPSEVYYIYRFAGTGSYHLSSYGYGKGYDQAQSRVSKKTTGEFVIGAEYKQDYIAMVQEYWEN